MKKQIKVRDLIHGWSWSGMCGDGLMWQYLFKQTRKSQHAENKNQHYYL